MAAAGGAGRGNAPAGGGGGDRGTFRKSLYPDHRLEETQIERFLTEFTDDFSAVAPRGPKDLNKYQQQLQDIADLKATILRIDLDDVKKFFGHEEFRANFYHNTSRYLTLFYNVADRLMPKASEEIRPEALENPHLVFQHGREVQMKAMLEREREKGATVDDEKAMFPPELMRKYQILVTPETNQPPVKLRDIKAKDVGSFVSVRGIVTRVTDVAPQVRVVAYLCQTCGYESYQSVRNKDFTPLAQCPSPACVKNQTKGRLLQQVRGSKFVRYQTVRLQEMHTEVPVGHIPRTTVLRVYGALTRTMKPGDLVTVSGTFLVAPYHGFRAVRAGLTTDTFIEVLNVVPSKKSYAGGSEEQDARLAAEVEERSKEADIFQHLSASIAPEIFGHVDIKKALMLLLVGGVTRKLSDGMKIRGDINILLMGDPGVAKSQLLKHIAHIAPRGIYTTGKGSSGVGLTAAVLRDPHTGDMSLEGGSLVLADMGICCIDEFDKMEEGDRTAIHEVMEQQTVSIAKAGITTTLNARAAVLAAANPVWGRWRPKYTPEQNLGLPASLLSRFDLTWIILDKADADADTALARHVTHVHIHASHPPLDGAGTREPFEPSFLRAYIARARTYQPFIPKELTEYIVQSYVELRKEGEGDASMDTSHYAYGAGFANTRQRFCTARMLLSILRLSQGLARLHFRNQVEREDVEEAMRLVNTSKESYLDDAERSARQQDPVSSIFDLIQTMVRAGNTGTVSRAEAQKRAVLKGFSLDDFEKTLDQYQTLGTWVVGKSKIQMITQDWKRAEDADDMEQ